MRGGRTMAHESGAHRFLAIDQLSSRPRVPSLRRALSGRPATARPHLLGSVPGDGLRPVDLSGESARHRSLFTCVAGQALPLGIPWPSGALDAGGRERSARLAHLRRFRLPADCNRARIVCPRAHGRRSGREPVCSGFDNHRSMSGAVSVGPVPAAQGSRQDAHTAGSAELCALVEPVYAKAGNGRPPVGAERMLRIYFLQQWFNLSDPGVEEALYDSAGMRQFVGIDLGREPVPDETTVCKFHLLEEHELGERLFERVGEHLQAKGLRLSTGTIVDATIINAPSSTKNARQERDPEMHQTRKGKQWYFGMKA